jgi:hypothetical protein
MVMPTPLETPLVPEAMLRETVPALRCQSARDRPRPDRADNSVRPELIPARSEAAASLKAQSTSLRSRDEVTMTMGAGVLALAREPGDCLPAILDGGP